MYVSVQKFEGFRWDSFDQGKPEISFLSKNSYAVSTITNQRYNQVMISE
jgi:hypothetical protein